jgi:hypothetical protein
MTLCPPGHKHDLTLTCFVNHHCGCAACVTAAGSRRRDRYRLRGYGVWDDEMVYAGPVIGHVRALASAGVSVRQIAQLSGVSRWTLDNWMYGRRRPDGSVSRVTRVHRDHARRIMAIPIDPWAGRLVPSVGVRRRVQALACLGWGSGQVAAQAGVCQPTLRQAMRGDHVRRDIHRRVDAAYQRLCLKRAPQSTTAERINRSKTVNQARANGWPPPLAWDDIDRDPGPTEVPEDQQLLDEIAISRALAGHQITLTPAERLEAVNRALAQGLSPGVAQRLLRTRVQPRRRRETAA